MDKYIPSLISTIKKQFIIPNKNTSEYNDLKKSLETLYDNFLILSSNADFTIDNIKSEFTNILLTLKPKNDSSSDKRASDKSSEIFNKLNGFKPKSILDFGAGKGDITIELSKKLELSKENVYAIDDKLQNTDELTVLNFENGKIPLEDNSIDLIISLEVLHHINTQDRYKILQEISRVLSPNGLFIIKEHDDQATNEFSVFLELIHIFWYIVKNENPDLLNLMTRYETINLMESVGLYSNKYDTYDDYNNPQQIYYETYTKNKFKYMFKNVDVKNKLQEFIYTLDKTSNIQGSSLSLPNRFQKYLHFNKPYLLDFNDNDKKELIKEYIKYIITISLKQTNNNIWVLTNESLEGNI
jgi:ubiquinone/menaquinone biosynthesis C-methylase UbiE